MTNIVKRSLRCLVLIALFLGLVPVAMMAAEGDIVTTGTMNGVAINYDTNTITVSETATMTGSGTGAAFTINANTTLVFEEGATLELSGYDNGFVVSGDSAVTLTSANMNITANSQMDVFRLRNNGQLSLTGSNTIIGSGKEGVTNRAIVLEGNNAQNQAITLGANTTLAAHSFYRGLETGGAKDYTISGDEINGKSSSIFDFSNNNCGMALSYFDSNANFKNCKLEVSNCDASGIFMRQDNAALDGLYIDNVNINCVNDIDLDQSDIAIRFHSNKFRITNSSINIVNAWNTGLWIYDGWNANVQNEIIGTTITVKNVYPSSNTEVYGAAVRKKAITMVPYREWLISDCIITMEGQSSQNMLQGGLNIASDMQIQREGFTLKAKPNMYGGTIKLQDTEINTANVEISDIGVQLGQFLEIGDNVVIDNGYSETNGWSGKEHYPILCDAEDDGYKANILGMNITIDYNTDSMSEDKKIDKRVKVYGGSFYSTPNVIPVFGNNVHDSSLPVNCVGDNLTMFTVAPTAFATYAVNDAITLKDSTDQEYYYKVKDVSSDNNRYIWAYGVTITLVYSDGSTEVQIVPCGAEYGLTQALPAGNWMCNGQSFTNETKVTGDITVMAQ